MISFVAVRSSNLLRSISCCLIKNKHLFTVRSGSTEVKRHFSSRSLYEVNTNVAKDVILYKNDTTKQLRLLNMFAIAQCVFWNYLANTVYYTMKDTPVTEESKDGPWYMKINFGQNTFKLCLCALCLIVGNGLMLTAFFYSQRSVKGIVLKKGGQYVDLITYSPYFRRDNVFQVPLSKISANENRASARLVIPLKIQDKPLYYLVDMDGKFGNVRLFDATVGLKRKLRK